MTTQLINPSVAGTSITRATAVASTSGTSIDFTGIPSTAKRIHLILSQTSSNGTSEFIVRIGSGSFDTTGYLSYVSYGATAAGQYGQSTTAFQVTDTNASAAVNEQSGVFELLNISGNTWVSRSIIGSFAGQVGCAGGGTKTLAGVLDRVRLTTNNGTDTFDLGTVNIFYE